MKYTFIILILTVLSGCKNSAPVDKPSFTVSDKWAMLGFEKADSINPILHPSTLQVFSCPVSKKEVKWEERNVLNPSAIVRDDKVYLIYRAQDNEMTSRIGLAISEDGLHFTKLPEPVFYPDNDSMNVYEWKGGVEDPRVIESPDGTYIMTYTSYDGKTARLCLASSTDLKTWTKHGLVLGEGKYRDTWSKSGAIVGELKGNKIIAANFNDPALPKFTYAAGQALFDRENPYKLINRMEGHFIHPDKPYEKTGEVNEVCFVEGLVFYKNKWMLYYGTADSKIAVAVKKD